MTMLDISRRISILRLIVRSQCEDSGSRRWLTSGSARTSVPTPLRICWAHPPSSPPRPSWSRHLWCCKRGHNTWVTLLSDWWMWFFFPPSSLHAATDGGGPHVCTRDCVYSGDGTMHNVGHFHTERASGWRRRLHSACRKTPAAVWLCRRMKRTFFVSFLYHFYIIKYI